MNTLIDLISQPWHWAVSGATIALSMIILTLLGKSFGVSMTFRNVCTMAGAGKKVPFFNIDINQEWWRMAFVIGGLVGGFIAVTFLRSPEPAAISAQTIQHLSDWGFSYPEMDEKALGFVPTDIFNFGSLKGVLLIALGGFLVGFGARYADGCTSGHAISGLSHLQLPSLITVIGFFIGGLLMTHVIMPLLF
jgi:uncharacterized membrane protein YedE/YeeE